MVVYRWQGRRMSNNVVDNRGVRHNMTVIPQRPRGSPRLRTGRNPAVRNRTRGSGRNVW